MKQRILSNWTLMRFLRLGMGLAILVQAILAKEIGLAFAGILFTALPVFNIGCCGTAGCAVPPQKETNKTKDITYEEVV
jgi:hypothetical protein